MGYLITSWNKFLYVDQDARIVPLLRIFYSILLIISILVLGNDLHKWYGPNGLMPYQASRLIVDPDTISIFDFLPDTELVFTICYSIFLTQAFMMLFGIFSKFQAASCFIWLVSFHHRNIILFDGEDTLFRLICFLLIFLPLDYNWSFSNLIKKSPKCERLPEGQPLWSLRLIQIQMSLLMISSVIEKFRGADWRAGDALYYASRLDDLWGHFPLPESVLNNLLVLRIMSWSVLGFEMFIPVAVWFRKTRVVALVLALIFHLGNRGSYESILISLANDSRVVVVH